MEQEITVEIQTIKNIRDKIKKYIILKKNNKKVIITTGDKIYKEIEKIITEKEEKQPELPFNDKKQIKRNMVYKTNICRPRHRKTINRKTK